MPGSVKKMEFDLTGLFRTSFLFLSSSGSTPKLISIFIRNVHCNNGFHTDTIPHFAFSIIEVLIPKTYIFLST